MFKYLNIIGWVIVAGLCIAAPLVNALGMYAAAFVGLLFMFMFTEATVYDGIDEEFMNEVGSKD